MTEGDRPVCAVCGGAIDRPAVGGFVFCLCDKCRKGKGSATYKMLLWALRRRKRRHSGMDAIERMCAWVEIQRARGRSDSGAAAILGEALDLLDEALAGWEHEKMWRDLTSVACLSLERRCRDLAKGAMSDAEEEGAGATEEGAGQGAEEEAG